MKVKELTSKLKEFNPEADVVVNINEEGERLEVTGIWSWSGYDGERYQMPRDIEKEKRLTPRVSLSTEKSGRLEDIVGQ